MTAGATEQSPPAMEIVLVAVNARYGHCGYAARTLLANLGAARPRAGLLEYDLEVTPLQLAADVLARRPRVAGFSVYLWNARLIAETLAILRRVAPALRIALGGPEIVPETAAQWETLAAALVFGEGESAWRALCQGWLAEPDPGAAAPAGGVAVQLDGRGGENPVALELPYALYDATDIRQRTLYVETSRGCPAHCLYCTSCDSGLRLIPLARWLPAFDALLARGARRFKFLDRTFNADEAHACAVLDALLARRGALAVVHLELSPAPLGDALRARLAAFPPGMLHLELGVQTLDEAVARRIGRPESRAAVLATLRFLLGETGARLHADLIFGLPGEDEAGVAAAFDALVRLGVHELQLNRLKGLPGTPLRRLPEREIAFNPAPPYEVLRSDRLDFAALARLQRAARLWELLQRREELAAQLPGLWARAADSPFARLSELAEAVQAAEGRLYALPVAALARHLHAAMGVP